MSSIQQFGFEKLDVTFSRELLCIAGSPAFKLSAIAGISPSRQFSLPRWYASSKPQRASRELIHLIASSSDTYSLVSGGLWRFSSDDASLASLLALKEVGSAFGRLIKLDLLAGTAHVTSLRRFVPSKLVQARGRGLNDMRAFYHPDQALHEQLQFMRFGKIVASKDLPERRERWRCRSNGDAFGGNIDRLISSFD